MPDAEIMIMQTKNWVRSVVIGCNFCPFAGREVSKGSVDYKVLQTATQKEAVEALMKACLELDGNESIETLLLILPGAFTAFSTYLQLVKAAERTLHKKGYDGIYQIASFHPDYLFGDADNEDAANYTNRSPYPMLQLLREKSVTKAVSGYQDAEGIPKRNIAWARERGLQHMQALLQDCFSTAQQ